MPTPAPCLACAEHGKGACIVSCPSRIRSRPTTSHELSSSTPSARSRSRGRECGHTHLEDNSVAPSSVRTPSGSSPATSDPCQTLQDSDMTCGIASARSAISIRFSFMVRWPANASAVTRKKYACNAFATYAKSLWDSPAVFVKKHQFSSSTFGTVSVAPQLTAVRVPCRVPARLFWKANLRSFFRTWRLLRIFARPLMWQSNYLESKPL